MKLLTFFPGDGSPARVGALLKDERSIVDLAAVSAFCGVEDAHFRDMLALLDAGDAGMEAAAEAVAFAEREQPPEALIALDAVELAAPVPRPRSIRDCMAFERHLIQAMRTVVKWKAPPVVWLDRACERALGRGFLRPARVWYQQPIYYKGNPASTIGPNADVVWPPFTQKLDYELEVGVYIGRRGRDIPVERAGDYIAGYTIFNDFSARDVQLSEMRGRLGPAKSKDFDTGNAMGPWLVTSDEIADPRQLTMCARVNGEEWSRGNTRDMHFTFAQIISAISEAETLYPGDFIGSGTVPGGCGLELDRWLRPGDVLELEVDGLGVLRNRVVEP